MRFAMIVAILLLGTSTVLGYEDNTDKEDVLARLLRVLTEREEKKEEHRPLLDELEEQLEKRKEPKCGELQTMCGNKKKCISVNKICNGLDDCGDKSDEKDCKNHKCLSGMKKCGTDPQCVVDGHWCDGYSDCSNGADEKGCKGSKYSNPEFENYFKNCKSDEKKCDNGNCYLKFFHCDGDKDCTDGSDEKNCPAKKPREVGLSDSTKNKLIRALVKKLLKK